MLEFITYLITAFNGQYIETSNNDLYCLSASIYFEARGDGTASKVGVANNIMQRVKSEYYPDNVCDVVHQLSLTSCAYSWWCDGQKDLIDLSKKADRYAYIQSTIVADAFINGEEFPAIAGFDGALLYHSINVKPKWAKSKLTLKIGQLGSHIHYLESRTVPLR